MKRTPISLAELSVPACFLPYLTGAALYDSSCSKRARVIYIQADSPLFLKSAPAGTLAREAEMTAYFARHQLSARVRDYRTEGDQDWLLTEAIPGEDGTHPAHLADPVRLIAVMADIQNRLRTLPVQTCPVPHRLEEYIAAVREGYRIRRFDPSYYTEEYGDVTMEEAYHIFEEGIGALRSDSVIHGDFCLPNFLMQNGTLSGLIDVDHSGVADRHIDLYWGAWSLRYNLRSDRHRRYFLDACGEADSDILRTIAAAECFG